MFIHGRGVKFGADSLHVKCLMYIYAWSGIAKEGETFVGNVYVCLVESGRVQAECDWWWCLQPILSHEIPQSRRNSTTPSAEGSKGVLPKPGGEDRNNRVHWSQLQGEAGYATDGTGKSSLFVQTGICCWTYGQKLIAGLHTEHQKNMASPGLMAPWLICLCNLIGTSR